MYPDISPNLKVKETISNPLDPAEVFGFEARNTMLGRPAIVMKESAISAKGVAVPGKAADRLRNEDAELVVLDGDVVRTMDGSDFEEERVLHTFKGGGRKATMHIVDRDNDKFLSWDESMVQVRN